MPQRLAELLVEALERIGLDGVLRRVLAGVAQEVAATWHGPVLAHLLAARYRPVATADGEVVGATAVFRPRHVLQVADLHRPVPADYAHCDACFAEQFELTRG